MGGARVRSGSGICSSRGSKGHRRLRSRVPGSAVRWGLGCALSVATIQDTRVSFRLAARLSAAAHPLLLPNAQLTLVHRARRLPRQAGITARGTNSANPSRSTVWCIGASTGVR